MMIFNQSNRNLIKTKDLETLMNNQHKELKQMRKMIMAMVVLETGVISLLNKMITMMMMMMMTMDLEIGMSNLLHKLKYQKMITKILMNNKKQNQSCQMLKKQRQMQPKKYQITNQPRRHRQVMLMKQMMILENSQKNKHPRITLKIQKIILKTVMIMTSETLMNNHLTKQMKMARLIMKMMKMENLETLKMNQLNK